MNFANLAPRLLVLGFLSGLAACSSDDLIANDSRANPDFGAAGAPNIPDTGSSGVRTPKIAGVPCLVSFAVEDHCLSCHGEAPLGAPMSLHTYEAITKPSSKPGLTYAQLGLDRIQGMNGPVMPPGGIAILGDELEAWKAWVANGAPQVSDTSCTVAAAMGGAGASGGAGSAGSAGSAGTAGSAGASGSAGSAGSAGAAGSAGSGGTAGSAGTAGSSG